MFLSGDRCMRLGQGQQNNGVAGGGVEVVRTDAPSGYPVEAPGQAQDEAGDVVCGASGSRSPCRWAALTHSVREALNWLNTPLIRDVASASTPGSSSRANLPAIGTLVERTTRFTLLLHLPRMDGHGNEARVKNGPALAGHGAEAVRDAIAEVISTLPEQLRRSLPWDQGAEMAQHAQLRIVAGLDVYFCDPHSRGSAALTRTPMVCSVSTSPRAPISPDIVGRVSLLSLSPSIHDHAKLATGGLLLKPLTVS